MQLIKLRVERSSREYSASSQGMAYLDPEVISARGLQVGAVVRLTTFYGNAILARIAEPQAGDAGLGAIRLDRFQRQGLKARMGEEIDVMPLVPQPVQRIRLQPFVDLSAATTHHLEEHLLEELAGNESPVAQGMLIFAHFHHSAAGTVYRVVSSEPAAGVVTPGTRLSLEPAPDGFDRDFEMGVTFEDVGGLGPELRLIRELVQMPLQFPALYRQMGVQPTRGVLFYGPPGTGKTHVARAIAHEVNAQFYYINGPEIVGTMYGESEGNLRRLFGEAAHHAPSIVLMDEIDAICPKRGSTGSHSDVRLVTTLLSLMDGLTRVEGTVVIGTTNRVDAVDTALRRPGRFDREIYFGPPDARGREEILQIHTREMPLDRSARAALPEIARLTHGFVGADLLELSREAALSAIRRSPIGLTDHLGVLRAPTGEIPVTRTDFENARRTVRPSAMRESLVEIPDVSWAEVKGLHEEKEVLRHYVTLPLKEPERYREQGLADHAGVILYGPPGTGKTMLVRALARETGVNFVVVDGPEIFSKWLGESEEAIRHIFTVARQLAPTLLFFDQLDALAPVRAGDDGVWTTRRVVHQLLAEVDGVREADHRVAVVAATNRIDLVDPSVLRPGRLGVQIEIPLPDAVTRGELFTEFLRSDPPSPALLEWLVGEAEGLSGADLRFACQEVRRLQLYAGSAGAAARSSRQEHFGNALGRIRKGGRLWHSSAG